MLVALRVLMMSPGAWDDPAPKGRWAAPTVLAAYTAPSARSPCPLRSASQVMRGSVMPAQNVVGIMTAEAIRWLATLNPA